jgi:hypothetical protein
MNSAHTGSADFRAFQGGSAKPEREALNGFPLVAKDEDSRRTRRAVFPLVRPINFHRDLVRQPGSQSVNLTNQWYKCRAVL